MSAPTSFDLARRGARLAGLGYVASIVAGLFVTTVAGGNFTAWGDPAATAQNLLANERLFRLGLVAELVMAGFVGLLTGGCYLALRSVSPTLATLGLVFRTVDTALVTVVVAAKLMALKALSGEGAMSAFSEAQRQGLSLFFAELHDEYVYLPLVFIGLGGLSYFAAFYRSRLVPRWLSAWGLFTYASVLVGGCVVLVSPEHWRLVQLSFLPGGAFEFLAGLWLLAIGIGTTGAGGGVREAGETP